MLIGSDRKLRGATAISVSAFDKEVEGVRHYKYLGVTLSSNVTWREHIENLSTKMNQRLGLLKRESLLIKNCYYNINLVVQGVM